MSNEPKSPKQSKVYEFAMCVNLLTDAQIEEAQRRAEFEPKDGLSVSAFLSGIVGKFVNANPDALDEPVDATEKVSEFQALLDTPLHVLAAQKDIGLDTVEYTG